MDPMSDRRRGTMVNKPMLDVVAAILLVAIRAYEGIDIPVIGIAIFRARKIINQNGLKSLLETIVTISKQPKSTELLNWYKEKT